MREAQLTPGESISRSELTVRRAQDVARLIASASPVYIRLVECRRRSDALEGDVLVLDVEVELPQHPLHDIRRFERLAVTFLADDRTYPEIEALRPDFPHVPHLNLRPDGAPKNLCLYEEPWESLRLRWSPGTFLEQIRVWLSRTARAELHEADRALEPLFLRAGDTLVLSRAALEDAHREQPRGVWAREFGTASEGRIFLADAHTGGEASPDREFVIMTATATTRTAGIIRRTPTNLSDLHGLLAEAGDDLVGQLRDRFAHWSQHTDLLEKRLLLLLVVPQNRSAGAPQETFDVRAFLTKETVAEVGCQIDIWEKREDAFGRVIAPDRSRIGSAVGLSMLNVVVKLSRCMASTLNGIDQESLVTVVAIGVGSLGSQVCLNLARAGWGQWTYVDEDRLLPHNLARHALPSLGVGLPKASTLAVIANDLLDDAPLATPIVANVLNDGVSDGRLVEALREADLILDMSASVPVARALVHDFDANARRISVFLNRSGTDLVVLAEDMAREVRLDSLEMQYYRSLTEDPDLSEHLVQPDGGFRYGQTCRDVSFVLPQELVALHASIAARFTRQVAEQSSPSITVFRSNPHNLTVERVDVPASATIEYQLGEWRLVTDHALLSRVAEHRLERLPIETGGVLLGDIDTQRQILYIAAALPSPSDSEEWPTSYIRGTRGLAVAVGEVREASAGTLDYIGEWHSHPDAVGVSPSSDDRQAISYLAGERAGDGVPAVFLVVGDGDVSWHLAAADNEQQEHSSEPP